MQLCTSTHVHTHTCKLVNAYIDIYVCIHRQNKKKRNRKKKKKSINLFVYPRSGNAKKNQAATVHVISMVFCLRYIYNNEQEKTNTIK